MRTIAIACILGCVSAALAAGAQSPATGVAPGRLLRLSRGANITQWFQVYSPQPDEHYRTYISDDELAMISRMGLTHVRLCISPEFLYDPADPSHPIASHLAMLKEGIKRIEAQGLGVVVDPHNTVQPRIENDGPWHDGYAAFWGGLASSLKDTNPAMTFFEIVNEPVFDKKEERWFALQQSCVAAIRAAAPLHTIIATGPNWGGVGGLLKTTPLSDRNVVYSLHFYEPFTFTHQGATWSGETPKLLRDVPYPSSPEAVADTVAKQQDATAKGWITDYGSQRWDRAKLKATLQKALDWAKTNRVPLYCGEFGVYPLRAPAESRKNWFRDYAAVLKESGVGYSVWGWDDVFGFARKLVDGKPVIDTVPVEALGLKNP